MQCERLCERIDQLIEPLERLEHASSSVMRTETRAILDKFLQCVDDCNHYIEKFKSSDRWYDEAYEYGKSEDKFHELNHRLSQLGQDLCVGLNIQQIFDRKQDRIDQQEDLKELTKKLDEIAQKMLERQCEQYRFIDKMLDKRLQSFRFSLAQNLLLQSNPDLLDEHQQFLHIPYKDLCIEDQPLGHGGFADVYKAKWLTHHDQVAVKIIRVSHLSNAREDFVREISTMYRIRYENILNVLGACIEPSFYAIVVEYMPLGSLYDILHRNNEQISFDWSDRYSLVWQMVKSINYLHNFNPAILHRDIKSANFLLKTNGTSNQKYLLKVCDFGLAEIRRETLLQSGAFLSPQIVGTFCWKAPELLLPHARHTKQSDIYSLGVVFWELATGKIPWNEYEDATVILIQVKMGERPTIPVDIPDSYKQLIQDAWNHDPQERPTCFQLMERIFEEMNRLNMTTTPSANVDLYSKHLLTKYDSTRTAVQVAEEENPVEKSRNSVQDSIIPQSVTVETTTSDELTSPIHLGTTGRFDIVASNVLHYSQQDEMRAVSPKPLDRKLSRSVDDLTSNCDSNSNSSDNGLFQIYRLEKRRPLHRKYISKENNS
ncbi:unnamed protein product [Adineta ricciae]|uniref:Protein kinase domain-containing protein n=2 Tax=Adineta ricciae TaxID=249248 RepID=A0A813XH66_ADIRI|nr:unnamed protein product [Adineta ricciae]